LDSGVMFDGSTTLEIGDESFVVDAMVDMNMDDQVTAGDVRLISNGDSVFAVDWDGDLQTKDGMGYSGAVNMEMGEDNVINATTAMEMTSKQSGMALQFEMKEDGVVNDEMTVDVTGAVNYDTTNIFSMGMYAHIYANEDDQFSLFSSFEGNEPVTSPVIVVSMALSGMSASHFTPNAQRIFRQTISTLYGVDLSQVVIVRFFNTPTSQKTSSLTVDVDIEVEHETEASQVISNIAQVDATELLTAINEGFEASGVVARATSVESSAIIRTPESEFNEGSGALSLVCSSALAFVVAVAYRV